MSAALRDAPKTVKTRPGSPRHPHAGGTQPYSRHVNPNRRPYRRPSAFPWWLWVVAPLLVIGMVAVLLVVT